MYSSPKFISLRDSAVKQEQQIEFSNLVSKNIFFLEKVQENKKNKAKRLYFSHIIYFSYIQYVKTISTKRIQYNRLPQYISLIESTVK